MNQLHDPSLLKERCLIDGIWSGEGETAVLDPSDGSLVA